MKKLRQYFYTILILSLLFVAKYSKAQTNFFWQYTAQNGLISSDVTCINQDTKGYLWIGTSTGISRFNGASFNNYNTFDNLFSNNVKSITTGNNGTIWILHTNGGVSKYENNKFYPLGFEYDTISQILNNTNGDIFFIGKKEVLSYKNNESTTIKSFNESDELIQSSTIFNNNLLISTTKKTYLINKASGEKEYDYISTKIFPINNKLLFIDKKNYWTLLDSSLNELDQQKINIDWNHITTNNNNINISSKTGIYAISITNNKLNYSLLLSKKNGLVDDNIKCSFYDDEGTLWMGTEENGILGLASDHFPIHKLSEEYGKLNMHVKIEHDNYLVYQHAILKNQNKTIYKNSKKDITAFYETTKGEKWIGTKNGLYITFPGTSVEYSFKELKGVSIKYIRQTINNQIVIVTDKTVYLYNQKNNRISDLFLSKNKRKFNIYSVVRVKNKIFLLGEGNIAILDGSNISYFFNWNDEKTNNLTFSSITMSDNGFWIGTQGKGIISYINANTYKMYSLNKSFPFKYINSIHKHKNALWVATQIGIAKIDIDSSTFNLYNQRHFKSINFNPQPAFCPDFNIKFYFISRDGLVEVNTKRYNDKKNPNLQISSFLVSGRDRNVDSSINLQYGKYPIEITFNALSISNKTYYQYKLSNYQSNWSNPTTQNSVEYSDLKPGDYTFTVKVVDPVDLNQKFSEKSLSFKIAIPFWKTTQFYIIVGAGTLLLLFALYITRIIRLRIQKRKLQAQVDRKTFQLSVQKKHLEQFSYSLSHDLKNPINNIKGLVEILEDERSDEIIEMLAQSTNVLETKLLSTLESIKKSQANIREITTVHFETVFERVNKSLLMLIRENNAEIKRHFHIKHIQYEESLIESIIYNLVSNAIKYRHPNRKPQVTVYTEQINEFVRISVEDNGLGLDVEKEREKIFSIFKRVHTNAEGTGIGLYMIKQMVEINGGSIDLISTPGEGTTFHVYLKNLSSK